jgi:hypothetical protein
MQNTGKMLNFRNNGGLVGAPTKADTRHGTNNSFHGVNYLLYRHFNYHLVVLLHTQTCVAVSLA